MCACCEGGCTRWIRFDSCSLEGGYCFADPITVYFCEDLTCTGGASIVGKTIKYLGRCFTETVSVGTRYVENDPGVGEALLPADAIFKIDAVEVECVQDADPEDPCPEAGGCATAVFAELKACDPVYDTLDGEGNRVNPRLFLCLNKPVVGCEAYSVLLGTPAIRWCFLLDLNTIYTEAEVDAAGGEVHVDPSDIIGDGECKSCCCCTNQPGSCIYTAFTELSWAVPGPSKRSTAAARWGVRRRRSRASTTLRRLVTTNCGSTRVR